MASNCVDLAIFCTNFQGSAKVLSICSCLVYVVLLLTKAFASLDSPTNGAPFAHFKAFTFLNSKPDFTIDQVQFFQPQQRHPLKKAIHSIMTLEQPYMSTRHDHKYTKSTPCCITTAPVAHKRTLPSSLHHHSSPRAHQAEEHSSKCPSTRF